MRGTCSLLAMAALVLTAPPLSAQTVADFAGTYELVRAESLADDGSWVVNDAVWGADGIGVIMYDGVGTMGVHVVRSEDARSDTRYFAYYGRYTVDAEARTVTHHLEGHVDGGQTGRDNVRDFEFDGNLLILTVEPQRCLRIVWRKRG